MEGALGIMQGPWATPEMAPSWGIAENSCEKTPTQAACCSRCARPLLSRALLCLP